ncbi:hypothetical protein GALMADRAFT_1141041 [Galerina marginata CBS 339.88]|uniref:Uncharacterized protein n=1 Tax=Galerina marginata (strain CBS 339.88) TaxID=685588 RepID=A0A067SJ51_GALM3|nr:hypothetical protein GALMADRAFT_1141041 [Galerina marginata CBS 339.88]
MNVREPPLSCRSNRQTPPTRPSTLPVFEPAAAVGALTQAEHQHQSSTPPAPLHLPSIAPPLHTPAKVKDTRPKERLLEHERAAIKPSARSFELGLGAKGVMEPRRGMGMGRRGNQRTHLPPHCTSLLSPHLFIHPPKLKILAQRNDSLSMSERRSNHPHGHSSWVWERKESWSRGAGWGWAGGEISVPHRTTR